MTLKHAILAASALAVLAVPVAASADPWWGGQDRGDHYDARDRSDADWRDGDHQDGRGPGDQNEGLRGHEWRDHDRWARRDSYDGDGDYARCYWTNQGHYNAWGQYEYQRVQVCR